MGKGIINEQEYLAFISYRHADNTEEDRQWATWLHQQLEIYDVPAELIGTTNLNGDVIPERIYPVFRDEVSLPADADLSTAIAEALNRSRFLIVLCSPSAVASRYMNEEILHFKRTGKQDRILAALILGEPNASVDAGKTQELEHDNTLECFPKALQYQVDSKGQLNETKRAEPIAADFRLPGGGKGITNPNVYKKLLLRDGRNKDDAVRLAQRYEEQINNARLKIIAGILDVPLETLTQRDKIYQLNKARAASRKFRLIAFGMGFLTLVALIAGLITTKLWQRSEHVLGELQGNLNFMNFELRGVLDKYVPQNEKVDIIKHIDTIVDTLQKYGLHTGGDQVQVATALMQKADDILKNTKLDSKQALSLYQQVHDISQDLLKQNPKSFVAQHNLSVSYLRIGEIKRRWGQAHEAIENYELSLEIAQTLIKRDPGKIEFLRNLWYLHESLGEVKHQLGQPNAALNSFQTALETAQSQLNREPKNAEFQHKLAISYTSLGRIYESLGQTDAALNAYQLALKIRQPLVKQDPGNTNFLRDPSISYEHLGDIQEIQLQTEEALNSYKRALEIRQTLAIRDSDNTEFQRDLMVVYGKLGDVKLNLNKTDEALKLFQLKLEISKTLTSHDPDNTQFQGDLSTSYEELGDILLRQSQINVALNSYQKALEIDQTLARHDPDNYNLQRNLSITYRKLGDAYLSLSQDDAALNYYQLGLEITQTLLKRDPDNQYPCPKDMVLH